VKEVPEPIDLAVFIVPADKALEPLGDAPKRKSGRGHCLGGMREVDQQGQPQEEIWGGPSADEIIGPNNGLTSTPITLTTLLSIGSTARPISYIAQTGNLPLCHAMDQHGGEFRHGRVAGLGIIDIEDSEVLVGRDPETKARSMYVEGFANPAALEARK
jgi:hypothetical protein